jgi:hypothetical protein
VELRVVLRRFAQARGQERKRHGNPQTIAQPVGWKIASLAVWISALARTVWSVNVLPASCRP